MVELADVNRISYLSARLGETDAALSLLEAGGGVVSVAVAAADDPTNTVHVGAEAPIAVDGLDEALTQLRETLVAELTALGVTT